MHDTLGRQMDDPGTGVRRVPRVPGQGDTRFSAHDVTGPRADITARLRKAHFADAFAQTGVHCFAALQSDIAADTFDFFRPW